MALIPLSNQIFQINPNCNGNRRQYIKCINALHTQNRKWEMKKDEMCVCVFQNKEVVVFLYLFTSISLIITIISLKEGLLTRTVRIMYAPVLHNRIDHVQSHTWTWMYTHNPIHNVCGGKKRLFFHSNTATHFLDWWWWWICWTRTFQAFNKLLHLHTHTHMAIHTQNFPLYSRL